jgi:hypothetical protein
MLHCEKIIFSGHAIQRMFERKISRADIHAIFVEGEIIAEYPDDTPFPSLLVCGYTAGKPLHVVVAIDYENQSCYIITTYIPTLDKWTDSFRTRR